jgi:hypothetical protein
MRCSDHALIVRTDQGQSIYSISTSQDKRSSLVYRGLTPSYGGALSLLRKHVTTNLPLLYRDTTPTFSVRHKESPTIPHTQHPLSCSSVKIRTTCFRDVTEINSSLSLLRFYLTPPYVTAPVLQPRSTRWTVVCWLGGLTDTVREIPWTGLDYGNPSSPNRRPDRTMASTESNWLCDVESNWISDERFDVIQPDIRRPIRRNPIRYPMSNSACNPTSIPTCNPTGYGTSGLR